MAYPSWHTRLFWRCSEGYDTERECYTFNMEPRVPWIYLLVFWLWLKTAFSRGEE